MNPKATDTQTQDIAARPARRQVSRDESLIFERSSPGKRGMEIPPLDVPSVDPAAALGAEFVRDEVRDFP
ncbi:MAG: hypothetical protein ACREQC_02165, partial [Candidatus Binataceae bacterium]